jgi:hypothetical protein
MQRELEVEVGVPVAAATNGDDRMRAGTLPPGRHATLRHTGHPAELYDTTSALLNWAGERKLTFDVTPSPDGERWAARLEITRPTPPSSLTCPSGRLSSRSAWPTDG